MTRKAKHGSKRKKQKAGLNKSISQSVLALKDTAKGGLMVTRQEI